MQFQFGMASFGPGAAGLDLRARIVRRHGSAKAMQKHIGKPKSAGRVKAPVIPSKKAGADPARHARDLRSTLAWLKAQGDLIVTNAPVNPDLEITGLQKHMDGGCPIMFNNVKGKPNHRVITNLFGDMNVINRMFGWSSDAERVKKLAAALRSPLKPVEISQDEAPCQEHVVLNPRDVNKYLVPIRHTTYEPELTVGSGIRCVTGPEFDGG